MNPERRELAAQIHAAASEHDAAQADRLDSYRILEPETAELLGLLVRATDARRILEIGTSIGYSTLWLADAAEATGGSVVSVEIDQSRSAELLALMAAEPAVTSTQVPIGAGIQLAVKR